MSPNMWSGSTPLLGVCMTYFSSKSRHWLRRTSP